MTILAYVFALVASIAATPSSASDLPVPAKGEMCTVALVDFRVLTEEDAASCCPGAPTAVRAILLIDPIGEPVDPAFSPSVGLLFDGESYKPAVDKQGAMKPLLLVRDVVDIFGEYPDLKAHLPEGFDPHLGLIVTFPATSFPERGNVELKLKAGYHREVEPFSFQFIVRTPGGN